MSRGTEGLQLIGLYKAIYEKHTRKILLLNKYALRNHADSLVEDFGLDVCAAAAEYYIKNYSDPKNINGFMYQITDVLESMERADKDRLDRAVQRKKLYDAMRTEKNVS